MPVRTVKIGYATGQEGLAGHGRKDSADSKASSQNSGTAANVIEPFPAPKIPPLGKNHLPNIPPADYANMKLNQAKVKSVMSGDSLILCAVNNPSAERILSLAYCASPHIKRDADEQWAFESREALRELVVGKIVQFCVLYTIPNTKREYGIVFLNDGRKLPEEMVKLGWIKLREDAGRKEDSEEALQQLDQLRLLEAKARADDKGIWQATSSRIDLQHDLGDTQAFLDTWKGKTVEGVVERVFSGDRLLVRLFMSPTKHYSGKPLSRLRGEYSGLTHFSDDPNRRYSCSYY